MAEEVAGAVRAEADAGIKVAVYAYPCTVSPGSVCFGIKKQADEVLQHLLPDLASVAVSSHVILAATNIKVYRVCLLEFVDLAGIRAVLARWSFAICLPLACTSLGIV